MYLAFDCETTGILNESNLLTAFFLVLDDELNIIDTFGLKLKHDIYNVSIKALEINKIDLIKHENDRHTYCIKDIKPKFLVFLEKYKPKYRYVPIGHNIEFDIRFIKNSGLLTKEEYSNYISCNSIDTIIIAQYHKLCNNIPKEQSLSLINLCKYFKINQDEKLEHNAEYDIKMTIELLKKFTTCETNENKKRKIKW